MTFSILSWNIWHLNQIEGEARLDQLLQELKRLVDEHKPDCIALSEVIQLSESRTPPVTDYLQKLGFTYNHYSKMTHMGDYWMSGVAICSRFKLSDKQRHVISKNGSAARHGYPGIDKEIISSAISMQGVELRIIVAHPSATVDSIKQHRIGMKNLEELIRSEYFGQSTLLLGDMNEWRLLPGSFRSRVKDMMNVRTGSMLTPTWRYNAHRFTPLRLNLDYLYWSKMGNLQLKDFTVLLSDVSDHRPLLATFTLS